MWQEGSKDERKQGDTHMGKKRKKNRHKGSWRQRELEAENDRAKERASVAESALAKVSRERQKK